MNRILVTGASGTVGTPLVAELDALGAEVLTMRSRGTPSCGTRVASFQDRDALVRAFEGVDTVLLLIPVARDMLAMARNAVAAARIAGVRRLVRIGANHAAADSPYALLRLHGTIDRMVFESGIPATVLAPCGFMQNWTTRFAAQVRSGTVTSVEGDLPRPWVDARDVAAAAATVLNDPVAHAGRTYRITGPQLLGVQGFAEVIGEAIGRPLRVRRVTAEAAAAEMLAAGVAPWLASLRDSLNRALADGLVSPVEPAARRLMLRPPIDARTFARDYAPAWRPLAA